MSEPELPEAGQGVLPGSPRLADLVSRDGERWLDYRKSLTPRYAVVWRDIVLCHVMVALGAALTAWVEWRWGPWWALAPAVPAAFWIGYWLHALATFGHEAAHHNIARGRRLNDRLADWLVWLYFGQSTARYRRLHWMHHTHLGDHEDTETSYHNCLSPWFLTRTLTGLYLLEVMVRYRHAGRAPSEAAGLAWPTVRTLVTHAVILGLAIGFGFYVTALVWVAGVFVLFPCFATVRQILEHRRVDAGCEIDFMQQQHGAVNRMFGSGFFSRYFGAAGFNRHMLHHWDPGISYTRFDDMEAFMGRTPAAELLDTSRTTYRRALTRMVRSATHG